MTPVFYDYYYLWAAGRLANTGHNTYVLEPLQTMMRSIGFPHSEEIYELAHTPWSFWIYAPLGYFNFIPSCLIWLAILFALVVITANICNKKINAPIGFLVFSFLCFPPVIKTISFGQVSLILALGLSAGFYFYRTKNDFLSGLFFSLLLLKPHLTLAFFTACFFRSLLQKRYKLIFYVLIGFGLQCFVSLLFYPNAFNDYFEHAPYLLDTAPTLAGTTLSQFANTIFNINSLKWPPLIFSQFVGSYFGLNKNIHESHFLFFLIPLSLFCSPHAFSHSMALLLPAYGVYMCLLFRYNRQVAHYSAVFLALLGVILMASLHYEYIAIIIPLSFLFLWLYFYYQNSLRSLEVY